MTKQDALDYIREHLTTLHSSPDIYEDGTCNIIQALEEQVIPILEREIEIERLIEKIFEEDPHAFDRVNIVSSAEFRNMVKEKKRNEEDSH